MVITDPDMPVMNGMALARELKRMNPDVAAIVSSGVASLRGMDQRRAELERLGVHVILKKPHPVEEILAALHLLRAAPGPAGRPPGARRGFSRGFPRRQPNWRWIFRTSS